MKKWICFIAAITTLHAIGQNGKRPLQPQDVYRMQDVEDLQVSPDGKWIAYVLRSVDSVKDKFTRDIWMMSWDGKENVQLTNRKESESTPRWSPDGQYLSFIANRDNDEKSKNVPAQIWVLDRRGGEAKKLTNVAGDIDDYAWSPDGKKIVLAMQETDYADTAATDIRKPYVIDRYHFKEDRVGYLDDRTTHLYIFDVASKKLDTLTSGKYNEGRPDWSPDGKQIVFVSNRSAEPDKNENSDLWLIDATPGGTPKQLTTWQGSDNNPKFSPDGKYIAYLQSTSKENFTMYGQPVLAVIPAAGGTPNLISASIDRPVRSLAWGKNSNTIVTIMEDDRQANIVAFNVNDKSKTDIKKGDQSCSEIVYNTANDGWATLISTPEVPAEIFTINGGQLTQLSHIQDSFLAPLNLAKVEGFKSTSKDGTIVGGLLYLPPNATTNQKLPLVLFIHGGPVAQDEFEFDLTRQMYAAAGYAVAAVNYRGSSGRGVDYIKAIYGDWGNKEEIDIIGAANYLIKQGIADENRMGIAGWSYGGISTNYTIATDPRFKAAVSGAGSSLQLSMYGVDQYVTQYETEIGAPWKSTDKWLKISYPFLHADKIKTPTLFMASQSDFNVPVAGAEQMYQALRSLGVPTELVIYPNQFHGINVPSYLIDRYQRHINWFNKYMK